MAADFIKNAVGRMIPTEINGKLIIPFKGVGQHRPTGRQHAPLIVTSADYPADGNKMLPDLKIALIQAGVRDGMTISTHHHFRYGDLLANELFRILAEEIGVKNLVWFPSAAFPCDESVIKYLEDGTIHHIEANMYGPLGRFTSQGRMKGTGILRSHGGRYQAIQDGEMQIDITVIAAPTADPFGNANGFFGPSACGMLGYAAVDSMHAGKVIVATDNLVPFPCVPFQIRGQYVDFVVQMDKIGIPERIMAGSTEVTKSPDRLYIAELTAKFCEAAGLIKDGFSFQAGAGGTSLSIGIYFGEILRKKGMKARFAEGGSNKYLVQMLEEGLVEYIIDMQAFDLQSIRSLRDNPNHLDIDPGVGYNYHNKGFFSSMVDVVILGATEVDVHFNANVVTHSDGYLLHGLGGWQNCLFGKNVILPIPLFRDRIPVIRDEVTTICGPGELVDIIVTERGIAINPRRTDLLEAVKGTDLPIKSIEELKEEAERICGKPRKAEFEDRVVAAIKWVDGTVIDVVKQVKE